MEGYRTEPRRHVILPESVSTTGGRDYSQGMMVALAFYLFGHLADLATTVAFLSLGRAEYNYFPALILEHLGLPMLMLVKVAGALATAWVFWRLRERFFTVIFTSLLAVFLIYVASINSLDVLEALVLAAR